MGRKYVAGPPVDIEQDVVRDSEGRRIDQEYIDEVVAASDSVRTRGRPSLDNKPGSSPQIAVRLPVETYDRAVELARERGVTLAALAREALDELVRKAG